MSIVHRVIDKLPNDGDIVFCDNGKYSSDRAEYKDGQFIGGGDFPVRPYPMSCVSKWFSLDVYRYCKGGGSYGVSFNDAELMSDEGYKPRVRAEHVNPQPYSKDFKLTNGREITLTVGGD